MNHPQHIILVGLGGVGKTTLGRRLARYFKWDFIDVDEYIIQKTGVDICTIFDKEGEAGFRDREAQALKDILQTTVPTVIATGGGCILREENCCLIRSQGLVIHLDVPVQLLLSRLRHDKTRPLLQGSDLRTRLQSLHHARDAIYRNVADIHYPSHEMKFAALVILIEKQLGDRQPILL